LSTVLPTADLQEVSIASTLARIVGAAHVVTDEGERKFFSQDVFAQGEVCGVVVSPGSTEEVRAVARTVTGEGYDLIARGGGMSYTGGYLPLRSESVIVDLSRLTAIIEINETDMFVSVEAGCTWASLHAALAPRGLRTPYWGPLSGLKSTVGGAASQNSVFFGSGIHGSVADTIIGVSVVLHDGTCVTTGSAGGQGANAFSRHYGPDLTGLFIGDAGAFGIKTQITLRLIAAKQEQRHMSFSLPDRNALVRAMVKIGRDGLATECFAFDPFLQSVRMKRMSLVSDAKAFTAVIKKSGLAEGVRMAIAGRRFAKDVNWPLHVSVEDRTLRAADDLRDMVMAIVAAQGGTETENTVPKAVHAAPFGPMNGMIGVEGERWVPVHGVLPNSRVAEFFKRWDSLVSDNATEMQQRNVTTGYLVTTVGPGATLVEPVFYWPDARMEVHQRSIDKSFLGKLPNHAEDLEARALVISLREQTIGAFLSLGATHFQVGKTYPLLRTRHATTADLLKAVKQALDPHGRVNPGALGLS
jgi:FAD/FMN-containing dehydrogenase